MELHAMQSGTLRTDADKISALWNARDETARSLEAAGKLYDAYLIYAGMSGAFKGLRDTGEAQAKITALESKAEVREAIKDEQQQFKKQREFDNQIGALIYADGRARRQETSEAASENVPTQPLDARTRLHALLADLRKQAKAENDSGNRRVARRVLEGQYIGLIERGTGLLREGKQFDEAARLFTLANEVNPDRSGSFYYLAWAYAAKGDKKKALQSIKTAIEKGFTDVAAINSNQVFDSLRAEKQYDEIIGRIKKP
jgi:tetratricopeptide (TPR) repeat protein